MKTFYFRFKETASWDNPNPFAVVLAHDEEDARKYLARLFEDLNGRVSSVWHAHGPTMDDIEDVVVLQEGDVRLS